MRCISLCALALIACAVTTSSFAEKSQKTTDTPPSTPPVAASPLLQDAVRVSPLPVVSLLVPHGWFSCDEATNALLGDIKVPTEFTNSLCKPDDPKGTKFKIVNPNLAEIVMGIIIEGPPQPTVIDRFTSLQEDELKESSDKLCASVSGNTGSAVSGCNVVPVVMNGHRALRGSVDGMNRGHGSILDGKFIAFETSEHFYLMIFADSEVSHAKTGPLIDAMLDSVELN
jgi:hypothetical protein